MIKKIFDVGITNMVGRVFRYAHGRCARLSLRRVVVLIAVGAALCAVLSACSVSTGFDGGGGGVDGGDSGVDISSGTGDDGDSGVGIGNGIGDDGDDSGGVTDCDFSVRDGDCDGDGVRNSIDVDDDNDGLIEISFLEDLNMINFDLNGDGAHNDGSGGTGHIGAVGAPTSEQAACDDRADGTTRLLCGYELTRDLDFGAFSSYRSSANLNTWTSGDGWTPIGGQGIPHRFRGIFDGNDYTITALMINRDMNHIGLFGYIGMDSTVRSLHLVDAQIRYAGDPGSAALVGALAGLSEGAVVAVSARGREWRGQWRRRRY